MSLFEDTNPRELKELLQQINGGEAALPDFQRDFVWDPHATQELIVSIASNYPAGSLLRIRNTHSLFAFREFQGAPTLNGHHPTYLVLDGQQRLTSLYQAFYGVGDHRYYVDLRRLADGADFEECIFHLRANHRKAKEYEDPKVQMQALILPLSVLRGGAGSFASWSLKAARSVELAMRDTLEDSLTAIQEQWIQTIDDYRFPVVTLSDKTNAEAVCTIFETLNRTGVKLSPFELLTARFWPKSVNLRHLWAKAQADHPIIADFDLDPYYVLQIVALLARAAPSCKRNDVLNLEASDIEQYWEPAVVGLARGLRLLRDDCGVMIPGWLPYSTIVIPLAAILARIGTLPGPQAGAMRQRLIRWFWCSVFGQAYENAPNSQSAKDFTEVTEWLKGGKEPEAVAGLRFDPRILRDTTARQRALYRGVISLIMSRHPRDFYNGEPLTGDLIIEHNVDDHHIFPDAFLKTQDIPGRLRDCVLNRTLIDRHTNQSISNRAPHAYMHDIQQALGQAKFGGLLESHLLPAGLRSPLWQDDFYAFLDWRQDALWREIQRVTGASEAADLLAEDTVGTHDFNEFETLNTCALRFDGYKYANKHGAHDNDYTPFLEPYLETGVLPPTREAQLCAFFLMQRSFNWGGADYLTKDSRFWQRYRELFLTVYTYDIPETYRLHDWWDQWERDYRPHLDEYVTRIRAIHAATAYVPYNKTVYDDDGQTTSHEVDDA